MSKSNQSHSLIDTTRSNELFQVLQPEVWYMHHPRPVLAADSLRNAENIGSLIRIGDNIGALELLLLRASTDVNQAKIRRIAASSYKNISWRYAGQQEIEHYCKQGYEMVCIETTSSATNIFETLLPSKPLFMVGNEVHGIQPALLDMADYCVYVPVPGPTRSLNVSHAMAVAVYEWWRQMHAYAVNRKEDIQKRSEKS
ncbi:MAG: hypothetical protein M0P54_00125 [Bacteroidales bacterium]|nr:hypothetical protein [Bacteroidales bacterium]